MPFERRGTRSRSSTCRFRRTCRDATRPGGFAADAVPEGLRPPVTVRWPAHVLQHDNKAVWFIHHYRQVFDLWDTPHRGVADDAGGAVVPRDPAAGRQEAGEARELFTNSLIVRDRSANTTAWRPNPCSRRSGATRHGSAATATATSSSTRAGSRRSTAVARRRGNRPHPHAGPARDRGQQVSPDYTAELQDAPASGAGDRSTSGSAGWPSSKGAAARPVPGRGVHPARRGLVRLSVARGLARDQGDRHPQRCRRHTRVRSRRCRGHRRGADAGRARGAFDRLYEDRAFAERLGEASFAAEAELNIDWEHVVARLVGDPA